jgi:hypothetical protein
LANQGAGSASTEAPEKPRKSASVEMEEKVSERRQCDKTDGEEWTTHKSTQLSSQRTESSADSDYSFESHASSSVESRSPRELEEGCDVFLELPQWCKRNPSSATGHTDTQDSPISSISHSPDDTTAGAEALSTTCTTTSTSKHITAVDTGMSYAASIPKKKLETFIKASEGH